jgi:lipopolysaccharide biosynthesis regulator YciM
LGVLERRSPVEADLLQIGDVLKNARRFIVHIYQRTYKWTKEGLLEKFVRCQSCGELVL